MAGGGEAEDNPVNINVVPMVDVIFCLCVFFMCSFKIKQLEGKFASWLPKDKGVGGASDPGEIQEMRVALFWDKEKQETRRQFGHNLVPDDTRLQEILNDARQDFVKRGKPDTPVIIDGEVEVPWKDIYTVVDICKALEIEKIEFAMGASAGK
jgi:biopolymer transport protein ExbD